MRNNKSKELNTAKQNQFIIGLIKHVSQPMIVTSADRRLLHWNAAFSKLTGYNNKELSDPIMSAGLTAPEWHESETKSLEKLQRTGKSQTFRKEYIRKDGSRVPVEVLIYQISIENGKTQQYVGLITDITERKNVEETSRQSEERYRTILEDINEGYWEVDLAGHFVYFNNAIRRLLGYPENEMAGMNYRAYTAAEDVTEVYKAFNQVFLTGKPIRNMHYEIVQKDKSKRFAETSVFPRQNEKGEIIGFRGVSHDITERRQLEEHLEKERKESKLILDSSPIIVFYKDKNGKIVRVNKAFAEALQMPEEDLLGKTVFDLYSAEIAQAMTDDDQEVFKSGRPKLNIIEQYESATGTRWVQTDKVPIFDKDGLLVGLVGFAQDITERKQMEEVLRRSEERYRTILEDSLESYFEVDLTGSFTFFNDAMRRSLGYSKEELIGMNYKVFTPPDQVKELFEIYNHMYRTGEPKALYKAEQIRKDGTRVYVEYSAVVIRNESGEIIGFRGIGRDITERRQMEEALRQSEGKYRSILESIEESYYEVDLAGNFTFFNESLRSGLGYSREELMGMNYKVYTPPEEVERMFQAYNQTYRTGEPITSFSVKQIRKDGTRLVVDLSILPIRNEGGGITGFRGVGRDFTERLKMEEVLRRSEERYRSIMDDIHEDYHENDLAGNYIFANDALCRSLGYTMEELIGMNSGAVHPPEDYKKIREAYAKLYRTGEPIKDLICTFIRKDGSQGLAELSAFPMRNKKGEIIGFRGVSRDITEHKRMEDALKRSEERYRTVLDEMEEGYYETDIAGNYTFFNDVICEKLGYSREELMGMNYQVHTDPKDIQKISDTYLELYRTGKPLKWFSPAQIRKDGTRIRAEDSVSLLRNENGEVVGFRGVSRDVTERKQMEEALKQSEERYRSVLDEMQDSYFEVDLAGNYTFVNDAICHVLGYTFDELIGKNYKSATTTDDAKKQYEAFHQIYLTGRPIRDFIYTFVTKEGRHRIAELSAFAIHNDKGEIVGFRGVSHDITQRVRMEEALRQSEERYRTLLEDMEESYYEDDLEGNFTFVNDALCRELGYSREELIGMNYKVYTPPENVEEIFQAYNQVYRTGQPIKMLARVSVTKDGRRVPIETSALPLRNEKGEIIGFRGVSRDISERKKAEEQRKELEQKAQLASRLASVGELASGVAHEINNPLTGVIGYAHLLLARKDISRDVRHDLEIINEGAQRVAGIVKKLLAFARQTKPEQRYVNINELIRNTLDLRAYELASNNIKVVLQLTRDMPMTIADPGQLQQVFLNLIINAETEMKLANDKGKLSIKTERMNNTLRISFKDTGPGIANDKLETIFDPFFTTREVGQGTGLGLSVCHGIITEHDGKIWAESQPGKGATFIIELPLVTEEGQFELVEPAPEESPKVTKAKILVVDDEPVIRQLVSQVLTEQGHTVETIDNAASALKMVKSKRYRLILLDIKMPGMSGIELYKQFQKIAPSLTKRIVFITGDVMGKHTIDFLNKTKAAYLMKPFEARDLKAQINRILAKK